MKKNTIQFRASFKKVIKEADIQAIEAAFHKFLDMSQQEALDLLWKLTYQDAEQFDSTIKVLGLTRDMIQPENASTLRNELRHHYGDNLMSQVSEGCQEAFSALVRQSDAITAYIVYVQCNVTMSVFDTGSIQKLNFLLNNYKEKNYFGGIRMLGFDFAQAEYLKSFYEEIRELFNALYKMNSENIFGDHLGEVLGRVLSNTKLQLPEEPESTTEEEHPVLEEPESTTGEEQSALEEPEEIESFSEDEDEEEEEEEEEHPGVNAGNVLYDSELFKRFVAGDLESLIEIKNLGYDLNEVVEKNQEIAAFLKAAENLDK